MYICNCVTGDTEVLLGDNKSVKRIKDLKEGIDEVMTINPVTLEKEKSAFYNKFSTLPERLYEIETLSGRTVKCTPEHPFLIQRNGVLEWIDSENILENDMLLVKHCVKSLPEDDGKLIIIDIKNENKDKLRVVTQSLSIRLTEACARLLALCLSDRCDDRNIFFTSIEDMEDVINDLVTLGLSRPVCRVGIDESTILISNEMRNFFYNIGLDFNDKFNKSLPNWLREAPSSVKREFLAAFQGSNDGGCIYFNDEFGNVLLSKTNVCSQSDDCESCIVAEQISRMFKKLNIKNNVYIIKKFVNNKYFRNYFVIEILNSQRNVERYCDIIWYRYSIEKIKIGSLLVEYLKISLKNSGLFTISEFKKKFLTDAYDVVLSPILNVRKNLPIEQVYDFTTKSGNHSFIVNSVIGSNCETPKFWESDTKSIASLI